MIHPSANMYGDYLIGDNPKIGAFCDVGNCIIGDNCIIQTMVSIPKGTKIGDNVFLGPKVTILNDKFPPSNKVSGVTVGDNSIIGGSVTILPGVKIGSNVKVGAGAVVTRDLPDGSGWWVGNPAKELKR